MAFLKKNQKPYAANKMGQYLSLLVILVVTTFSSWSYSGLLKPICTSGTISGSSASSGKRLLLKSPFQNDWVLSHCHNNPNPSQDSGDDLGNISPDKQIPGGTFTFFHNNHQGSPLAASDHAGELLWQEEYKPYGEKLVKQDATNTIGYTGHQFDRETGLTYMQARYYDPVVGRFMGVDAVGFVESNPMSFNRYAYANNNPYKYVDPDGEFAVTGAILLTYGAVSLAWSVYDTYTTVSGVYSGNITAGEAATNFAVDTAVGLVGGAAAKGGLKLLRKSKLLVSATTSAASRLADKAQSLPGKQRPNTVAVIKHKDGTITVGRNQGGAQNSTVQNALNNAPQNCFAGQCAEINALSRALNKGRSLDGATISVSNVRGAGSNSGIHGTPKAPCSTCASVLDQLGVKLSD